MTTPIPQSTQSSAPTPTHLLKFGEPFQPANAKAIESAESENAFYETSNEKVKCNHSAYKFPTTTTYKIVNLI